MVGALENVVDHQEVIEGLDMHQFLYNMGSLNKFGALIKVLKIGYL